MTIKNKLSATIFGFLCIVVATPATFGLVIMMNSLTTKLEEDDSKAEVTFTIEHTKPKKKKERPKKMEVKKKRTGQSQKQRAIAPLPQLGSSVSGIQVEMPDYEGMNMTTASESLIGEVDNVVMTEDTVDNKPVASFTQQPVYPSRARSKNINGNVMLNILIGKDGAVKKIKVLEVDPEGYKFEQAAVNAVRNWRFQPATYKGKPVKVWATLPLGFELRK